MAQDFRHGHGRHRKAQYQRKSQQHPEARALINLSLPKVWAFAFLLAIIAVFLVQPGQETTPSQNIEPLVNSEVSESASLIETAKELKEKAIESVEKVSKQLEPPKVEVEAVEILSEEKRVEETKPPIFSFYEGLEKSEVVVDAVPISIQLESPFYIQAGTFGSERVAKIEQNRLAKMGQTLELSTYQGTKRLYFRLRVGPYTDRLALNKKRNELRKLGVDTLLVKAAKPHFEP